MFGIKLFSVVFALLVGCYLYTIYTTHKLQHTYPIIGDTRVIDGNLIHFVDRGDGQVIVLLHGASSSLRDYTTSIFNELSKQFRVIAIDRPGYGNSTRRQGPWMDPKNQARVVHELLSDLDINNPILVGHSWSGALVLAYLLEFEKDIDIPGAILIAPAIYPWYSAPAVYNRLAGVPVFGKLMAYTVTLPLGQLFLDKGIQNVFFPSIPPKNYRKTTGIDTILTPKTFLANAEDLRNLSEFLETQSREYPSIKTPILGILGGGDTVVSNKYHSGQLQSHVSSFETVTIEDTGHVPHHSHQSMVVEQITNFAVSRTPQ